MTLPTPTTARPIPIVGPQRLERVREGATAIGPTIAPEPVRDPGGPRGARHRE